MAHEGALLVNGHSPLQDSPVSASMFYVSGGRGARFALTPVVASDRAVRGLGFVTYAYLILAEGGHISGV